MSQTSRRSLLKHAVLGLSALALSNTVASARPAPATFTPKGSYNGTYESTEGHGTGKFTLKVSKATPGPENSFQIKGTMKLGKNSFKVLLGTVVPNPDGGWVLGAPGVNSKRTVFSGIDVLLNDANNTFTGNYQLLTDDNHSVDAGTLSGNKK